MNIWRAYCVFHDYDDACEPQPRYSGWGCAVSSKMAAIGSRWHTETPLSYTADQLQLLAILYSPKIVHFSLRREKFKCCISWTHYKRPHILLQFRLQFESFLKTHPHEAIWDWIWWLLQSCWCHHPECATKTRATFLMFASVSANDLLRWALLSSFKFFITRREKGPKNTNFKTFAIRGLSRLPLILFFFF